MGGELTPVFLTWLFWVIGYASLIPMVIIDGGFLARLLEFLGVKFRIIGGRG